ncbi:arrestin domain-containing protein 1-like isoform X2 [Schistocerca gregaria]|uniref:arrestin domain-containing protein 1-like isoform X2 n=1 Tax=Schistocerca gregaria TaxID=7010 RepID=UPI00211EE417|nr:arrestin domain-containing protein 1-like isoform X2 [Schistocerca gregaria]
MQNSKLQISLSNASKIYFPGQVVRGEVELYLNEPLSFSVIITSISGIATIKTHGTEGSPQRNKRVRVYFEKVFQFCSLSDGVNNKNPLWNEGSHKYNFTYKLPKGIPSSFESPDGHVRYKICAFVDAAETQNQNLTDMRFFCVNSVLNLNGINKISSPKTVFKHDELSCLCIRFRTVSVVLSLMKRGFVPGENIVINAVVYNGTSSVIPRVEAKLVQRVKYNFKNYSTELKGTVAEIVRGPVMPSESQIWRNEKLLIPPVVTSQLLCGNLINVDYKMCQCQITSLATLVPTTLLITVVHSSIQQIIFQNIPLILWRMSAMKKLLSRKWQLVNFEYKKKVKCKNS